MPQLCTSKSSEQKAATIVSIGSHECVVLLLSTSVVLFQW